MSAIVAHMIFLLTLIVLGLIIALALQRGRIGRLERRLDLWERHQAKAPARPAPIRDEKSPEPPLRTVASVVHTPPQRVEIPTPAEPEPAPPSPLGQTTTLTETFENLIGNRLPIWIGGAALVLAGFFLVRYSIEAGLLGPAARAIIAAIFGVALIAASEAARRLPQTADDPRIAQALAGAGIASLYGTLYMAGELYGLIGGVTAFVLMLIVTGAALGLSLRHGPPTAIMGLIGGFAAPLVTGYSESNLVPLLIYLALFTAALFGLAIARGWAWLALAAAAAGFVWSAWLIAVIDGGAAAAIGPFILILALGATLALPRLDGERPALRLAPLLLGLFQLLLLAPRLDFSPLAWALYALLAAATLFLAARDARLRPAVLVSLALLLVLLAMGLVNGSPTAPAAAIAFTLLYAGAGHALMARTPHRDWTLIALAGSAAPFVLARALWAEPVRDETWALCALAAAASCAWIAWRCRLEKPEQPDKLGHLGAPLITALLVTIGLAPLVGAPWTPLLIAFQMLALALWARKVGAGAIFALPAMAWAATLLAAGQPLADYGSLAFHSLAGFRAPYSLLPDLADALIQLALPAAIAAALLLFDPRQFARFRWLVASTVAAVAALIVYHLTKLPLAIASPEAFLALGFTERAIITQALFTAAWGLARRPIWRTLAAIIAAAALGRIVWFDLLLLNPLLVAQAVGPLPVFNAAVLHAAATTIWLWLLARALPAPRLWRTLSFTACVITALAIVRQASHGSILTGAFGQGETWLYSAAMLAVAIAWLARGIMTGAKDLRVAGLALLTLVTLKVFLVDAAALGGILRILSFLGLGLALIGIGWAYGKVLRRPPAPASPLPRAGEGAETAPPI